MIELSLHPDGVAEIRFDAPGEKVNILNEAALARLDAVLGELEGWCAQNRARAVAVTSGKPGVFLAGADVKAFVAVAAQGDPVVAADKARVGQRLFSRLAALPAPTVAALNGVCLGGGLELALACTGRIAADGREVSLGLPEVRLGLVPGWGGTQRLPRLVGLTRALDMILTGRSLTGRQALRIGLVDAVVPAEGIDRAARAEALRLAAGGRPRRPRLPAIDRLALARPLVLAMARRKAVAQTGGHYPAPPAAIETIAYGLSHGLAAGLDREADQVGRLLTGPVSRHLVGIFLASRAASAAPSGRAGAAAPPAIERVGVLGAGTMGGGIAAVCAMAGLPVRLRDVSAEALSRGMKQVHALAESSARKGRMARHDAARRLALVAPTIDASGFARCDLVIEAVVEDLQVKRQVVREFEAILPPSALLATNTSSLSVADIAAASTRPGRVLGLHFFNPVEKMPLLEIVRGPATDDSAVEAALQLARRLGKTPVVVKDTPGFIVNRILMPYLSGAMEMLGREGPDPRVVQKADRAMTRFGMPMGPFALLDRIGIDVAAKVAGVLHAAFGGGSGALRAFESMTRSGFTGFKAGRGFYRYRGGRARALSPEVAPLVRSAYLEAADGGPAARRDGGSGGDDDIADRLVDAMVNEAARLLDEGAVDGPEVIDLAMVFGAGFPPFRGGLLRHADAVGPALIASRLAGRGIAPADSLRAKGRFFA